MTTNKSPLSKDKDRLVSHGSSADKQWAKVFSGGNRPAPEPASPAPYTPPAAPASPTPAAAPAAPRAGAIGEPVSAPSASERLRAQTTAPAPTAPHPAAPTPPAPTPAAPTPAAAPAARAPFTPTAERAPVAPPPVGGMGSAGGDRRPPVPPPPVGGAPSPAASLNRPTLTDEQFKTFSDLIYELSGMRFEKSKSYFIATKLEVRCKALGISNFDDYYTYLQSLNGRAEYGHMIDEMTINETFFFRHQPQLTAFASEVLQPMVFARKQQHATRLRIWSCAASTGDEAYTVALMLKDMDLGNDLIIEIVGTDICHEALAKARSGRYKKYSVRNIPEHMMQKYFTYDEATRDYILSDEIKQMVRFQESNLMDPGRIGSLGKFDIAFCRNVLIYFDDTSKTQVVQNIVNAMQDDGVVLMGHSENIHAQRHLLQVDRTRTASLSYVKV